MAGSLIRRVIAEVYDMISKKLIAALYHNLHFHLKLLQIMPLTHIPKPV